MQVRGVVIAEGYHGLGGVKIPAMMQSIVQQASQLGANAVVDLKTERTGENAWVLIGTAVLVA
jgi:uncharacterized protein YbjQ (UPF0145 family)